MHTLWKGSISFGLVNIPVKMHAATESHDFQFNYLHDDCHNRIRYVKRCPVCDEELEPKDIIKGYEFEKGKYVIISDEDLESIEKPMNRSIDILDFINLTEVDPIYFQKSYFLSPEETAHKAYRLLCSAMEETGKIALARVILRSKQHLACIRIFEEGLIMETMYYPDEIRHMEAVWTGVNPTDTELNMATQLVENLAKPFDPEKYHDETREELKEMIESKISGQAYQVEPVQEKGKVFDLMEALRLSIADTDKIKGKPEQREEGKVNHTKVKGNEVELTTPDEQSEVEKSSLTPRKRVRRKAKGA